MPVDPRSRHRCHRSQDSVPLLDRPARAVNSTTPAEEIPGDAGKSGVELHRMCESRHCGVDVRRRSQLCGAIRRRPQFCTMGRKIHTNAFPILLRGTKSTHQQFNVTLPTLIHLYTPCCPLNHHTWTQIHCRTECHIPIGWTIPK